MVENRQNTTVILQLNIQCFHRIFILSSTQLRAFRCFNIVGSTTTHHDSTSLEAQYISEKVFTCII